jgi:hypothetical protein
MMFRVGNLLKRHEAISARFFDQGIGDVYWQANSHGPLNRINASGASEEADLPVFNGDQTVSIRTMTEANGTFSLTGPHSSTPRQSSSFWFRPLAMDWDLVLVDLPKGQRLLPTFRRAQVEVANSIIRIFPSNTAFEPLIFRFSENELEFVSSLPAGTWEYHKRSQNWIGRVGPWSRSTKPDLGYWQETPETLPPHFLVLGPDETVARLIPGLTSQNDIVGEKVFYHPSPITISGENPVFVHADEGIVALDGVSLSQIQSLPYDEIGDHPDIKSLGSLTFIKSELGVFVLNDNLSLHKVANFPVEGPWPHEVRIGYIEPWQTYLVIDKRSGEIYVSKDMDRFIKLKADKRVTGVVGLLAEPPSVLVLGEDQLYAVKQDGDP